MLSSEEGQHWSPTLGVAWWHSSWACGLGLYWFKQREDSFRMGRLDRKIALSSAAAQMVLPIRVRNFQSATAAPQLSCARVKARR